MPSPLAADEDETARLVMGAKTDSERGVTYDPPRRPEVSNLILLAALCLRQPPERVADDIGPGGSARPEGTLTEVLKRLRRSRRAAGSCSRSWLPQRSARYRQ